MCRSTTFLYNLYTKTYNLPPFYHHACSKKNSLKLDFFLSLWVKVSLFFSTENFYIIVDMMGKYSLRFFWHSFVLKVRMSKSDKRKWLALFHTHTHRLISVVHSPKCVFFGLNCWVHRIESDSRKKSDWFGQVLIM